MQTIRTHNAYHLGDNLVHLHFLRKVAVANPDRQFVHYAQNQYNWQLRPVIEDILNLKLRDYGYMLPNDSINAWRGDKGIWYESPIRNDFVGFHLLTWFPYLCERMGVKNPMNEPKDMLFDYPAIRNVQGDFAKHHFDVLIIDAAPGSGQFSDYNQTKLVTLSNQMRDKGFSTALTGSRFFNPLFTATQVGNLSLLCHTIVMVSTGPSWPTFNVWNHNSIKHRIILLDNERINLSPNTMHCQRIEEAEEVLKQAGLL